MYWLFQFLGWSTFAILQLITKYMFTKDFSPSDVALGILIFAFGISFSHLERWVYKKFNWQNQDLRYILHKAAGLAVLLGITNVLFLHSFVVFCPNSVHHSYDFIGVTQMTLRLCIIYFLWGVLYWTVYFFRNFKKAEILNLKNKAAMTEIHLNKLKSQLNPHFMFNAMNVIRALVDEDGKKAKTGITQLSNILRHTLNVNQKQLISIEEELEIVNDYLSLEKLRFEERLNWKIVGEENARAYQIPPLLLQTLVENAIKHGISNEVEGGLVNITFTRTNSHLEITVCNPGTFTLSDKEQGYGLRNSIDRLDLIFGPSAKLEITNVEEKGVCTTIWIPKNKKLELI